MARSAPQECQSACPCSPGLSRSRQAAVFDQLGCIEDEQPALVVAHRSDAPSVVSSIRYLFPDTGTIRTCPLESARVERFTAEHGKRTGHVQPHRLVVLLAVSEQVHASDPSSRLLPCRESRLQCRIQRLTGHLRWEQGRVPAMSCTPPVACPRLFWLAPRATLTLCAMSSVEASSLGSIPCA